MNASATLRLVKYLPLAPGQPFCLAASATMRSRYGWANAWFPTPCSLRTTMATAPSSASAGGRRTNNNPPAASARQTQGRRTAVLLSQIGPLNQSRCGSEHDHQDERDQ